MSEMELDRGERERWDEELENKERHRSKEKRKSSREEEKEYRSSRDKERDRERVREKEKQSSERRKERSKKEEDYDSRTKHSREKEKERDLKDRGKDKEKSRDKGKEKEKERRDERKERSKEKEGEQEKEKEASRDKENKIRRSRNESQVQLDQEESRGKAEDDKVAPLTSELEERILKMKEERLREKSDGASEILSWVGRSRKLEEKRNAEREKALQLSKIFEEQDKIVQEESDEEAVNNANHDLAGVKVLHGLDKVMEGGAVVLTLKDQSILANGDVNEDVDMLENVEIGEQKRRDEAYKAAKKKTGVYDDKFNDEAGSEKKILPQYDEPEAEEGVTLDKGGRFSVQAEKKLEELRRRLQGSTTKNQIEDLTGTGKISSDYYTHEEMLQFKKPKKKKSLRKKDKLDIDALEAEAKSAGLGAGDLGSRSDGRRQAIKEEQERLEAEMRKNAYQSAYAKADEASKSLRHELTQSVKVEEDEDQVFADDSEDLYKSLERARKLVLKKQEETASGPQAIALLATATANSQATDDQNATAGESQENKVVFTEMEEFVWGLQLDEEAHKPDGEDVFMYEEEPPETSPEQVRMDANDDAGGWTEIKDDSAVEKHATEEEEEVVLDETIHEVAVGKGLSGALKLLKDRGALKESIEWGGRNMDKKKSKLVGIVDDDKRNDKFKDIRIERTDEFGRILTPKEAFRMISHKFHGKGPGKMKQEKRMKQYQEELKLKQMKNSDTPSLSVERMREAQAQAKTPYLVLSGHVKPGQTSDPRSGFATVEKDFPGSLTPMLGDRKVEHFLGIKRKAEPGNASSPKKPKT